MAISQALTTSFFQQLLEGVHDFRALGGDTFKVALYSSTANLGPATTAYTTTGEVSATGYTAGGATLTCVAPTSSGLVAYTNFSNVSWTANISAAAALIYNTTPAHTYTNPSVMVLSFGFTRQSVSGVFTLTMPSLGPQSALIRLGSVSQPQGY